MINYGIFLKGLKKPLSVEDASFSFIPYNLIGVVYNFKVEFEFSLDVISFFPPIFAEAGHIGQGRNVFFS